MRRPFGYLLVDLKTTTQRAKQYMQVQNKHLTFKQQLNSRSTESSLPYSEEQRGIYRNLLEDKVLAPIQEPVAFTGSPVQDPVTLQAGSV